MSIEAKSWGSKEVSYSTKSLVFVTSFTNGLFGNPPVTYFTNLHLSWNDILFLKQDVNADLNF